MKKYLLVSCLLLMFLCNNDINTPLYTKGQIIDSYYNKGHNYKFQYTVANKKHFLTKRAYISNLKEGEYYMIEYDSLNPKNAKVNLNKPFIEDSTSYEGNFARVIKIEDKQSNRILFKYTYGNKEYQRVQYYNGKINIGDELNILVKFNNPNISYIK